MGQGTVKEWQSRWQNCHVAQGHRLGKTVQRREVKSWIRGGEDTLLLPHWAASRPSCGTWRARILARPKLGKTVNWNTSLCLPREREKGKKRETSWGAFSTDTLDTLEMSLYGIGELYFKLKPLLLLLLLLLLLHRCGAAHAPTIIKSLHLSPDLSCWSHNWGGPEDSYRTFHSDIWIGNSLDQPFPMEVGIHLHLPVGQALPLVQQEQRLSLVLLLPGKFRNVEKFKRTFTGLEKWLSN